MRGKRLLPMAVSAMLLAIGLQVRGQDPVWQERIQRAEKSIADGDVRMAQELYRKALATAQTSQQRALAATNLAGILSRSAPGSPEAREARSVYQSVSQEIDASEWPAGSSANELRCLYHNNFGAFLLREGDASAARDVLGAIEKDMRDPRYAARRPGYLYNLAQAMERSGNSPRALELYQEAALSDSTARRAADAVLRLAKAAESAVGAAEASRLLSGLLERSNPTLAEKYLRSALMTKEWLRERSAMHFPTLLVRYLTRNNVGPEIFASAWQPLLEKLQPAMAEPASARVAEIVRAYGGKASATGRLFENVGGDEVSVYSAFVKMLGDWFARADQPRLAYQRYAEAWDLDRRNTEAVVYMTNILFQYPTVDPDGRLLEELTRQLFEQKGGAYAAQDEPNIVRLHTLLGAIFERQGKMGPAGDPRSAIFQYEHALAAQKRLQAKGAAADVPGLNERLAAAYDAIGERPLAYGQYVAAAQTYSKMSRYTEAAQAVKAAETLKYTPPSDERQKIAELQPMIRSHVTPEKTPTPALVLNDDEIKAKVKSVLSTDAHVKSHPVDVKVATGVVTLTGAAPDYAHKKEAEKLAKETPGVKNVKNLIEVRRDETELRHIEAK